MLSKRFSLLFYLEKPKKCINGKYPIYLRITIDEERMELSAQRDCDPVRWNIHSGRVNGIKEETKSLNVYLDTMQAKIYEAHRDLLDKNEPITVENMKKRLRGSVELQRNILEVFSFHNIQMKILIKSDEYAKGTWVHFETAYRHLCNFIKYKFRQEDLPLNQIDFAFISDFEFYLKSDTCAHNTAMKYLGYFRKIVLSCLKSGWLHKDPFFGYKLARREVNREVLNDNEMKVMAEKKFASERITQVRDIFLFCCYTGLAYADVPY
ncbi:hypothetical protein FM036_45850 [Nostoc sp. HG1]|nr:hypothetical protein [Nostoc sp. HG1]